MMAWQEIIHLILIYGCLVLSFLFRKRTNSKLYIYFIIVCILETLPFFSADHYHRFYSFGSLFYMVFFTYYFSQQLTDQKNTVYALGLFSFYSSLIVIFNSEQTYPIVLAIIFCTFFILLSFLYFFVQLKSRSQIYIFQKEGFWVSVAILFWSVFFLFRIIPMPWLAENDVGFLLFINTVFKVATVVNYVFFVIAVTRQY